MPEPYACEIVCETLIEWYRTFGIPDENLADYAYNVVQMMLHGY